MSSRASLALNNNEQVIVDTGRLIKLDRGNIAALVLRAQAYYQVGEMDSALKHLREGLRYDPEHKESQKVYKKLRKLERKLKSAESSWEGSEWEDAASAYIGALREDPDHRVNRLTYNLKACEAYKNAKKSAECIKQCTAAGGGVGERGGAAAAERLQEHGGGLPRVHQRPTRGQEVPRQRPGHQPEDPRGAEAARA